MDIVDIEENLFALGDPKLHGEMCKILSYIYCKVLGIFPVLEAARPRSTTGIQALCSLHIALEKTKNILQHCSECRKIYLAITGDSIVLKFEKARFELEDSLRRVQDIVPQTIGYQVHRACTKEGMDVAVKIQYPGVAGSIESDIENVKLLLKHTNLIPEGLFLDIAIKESIAKCS